MNKKESQHKVPVKFRFKFREPSNAKLPMHIIFKQYSKPWSQFVSYVLGISRTSATYTRVRDLHEEFGGKEINSSEVMSRIYKASPQSAELLGSCSLLFDLIYYDFQIYILACIGVVAESGTVGESNEASIQTDEKSSESEALSQTTSQESPEDGGEQEASSDESDKESDKEAEGDTEQEVVPEVADSPSNQDSSTQIQSDEVSEKDKEVSTSASEVDDKEAPRTDKLVKDIYTAKSYSTKVDNSSPGSADSGAPSETDAGAVEGASRNNEDKDVSTDNPPVAQVASLL